MPWPEIYSFIASLQGISFWFACSGFFFGFGFVKVGLLNMLCKKVGSDGWFVLSFNVFGRFVC